VNKRRLLKLADVLDADAKNKKGIKFNLFLWGRVTDESDVVSCGTTACAAGLAAISGVFAKQGLSYRVRKDQMSDQFDLRITLNGRCRNGPTYDGSFLNIKRFFGLSVTEAEFIFTPRPYNEAGLPTEGAKGERAVAKRIRKFVVGEVRPQDGG